MSAALPATATNKVLKRALRVERWKSTDPVLWRREKNGRYELLDAADAAALEEEIGDRLL